MSWGAQNRSADAKTPSTPRGWSDKPEPGLWPVQPYAALACLGPRRKAKLHRQGAICLRYRIVSLNHFLRR